MIHFELRGIKILRDIKNELDNPTVRNLVSESAWDKSPEATDRKMAEFRRREDWHLDVY